MVCFSAILPFVDLLVGLYRCPPQPPLRCTPAQTPAPPESKPLENQKVSVKRTSTLLRSSTTWKPAVSGPQQHWIKCAIHLQRSRDNGNKATPEMLERGGICGGQTRM